MNQSPTSPLDPSQESLARRAELGKLFSVLRRVRSRTPFFKLPAHTIPTLWGLYRGLRREAPTPEIRWRIRKLFEKNRSLTGTQSTIKELKKGYKWLDTFRRAQAGDTHLRAVLARYTRLIAAKREKENWKQVMREQWDWQMRLNRKPILTGALIAPTLDNKPMPRLWPQPDHISTLIRKRKRAREKRLARQRKLFDLQEDLRIEAQFEENLARDIRSETRDGSGEMEVVFGGPARAAWGEDIKKRLDTIDESFARDKARLHTPISAELFAVLSAARRYKIDNKTRERTRERRGVILKKTLERARGGPPAHILETMTEREKHVDKIVRLPGEVGYVGMIKRKAGMKLKDGETWTLEDIAGEEAVAREEMVYTENEGRRRQDT